MLFSINCGKIVSRALVDEKMFSQLHGRNIPLALSAKTVAGGKTCGVETAIEPSLPAALFARKAVEKSLQRKTT